MLLQSCPLETASADTLRVSTKRGAVALFKKSKPVGNMVEESEDESLSSQGSVRNIFNEKD